MSTWSPWDYEADTDPSPERVCIVARARAIIVPMIGAPDILVYHGALYFRTILFLSGVNGARYLFTASDPTLSEKRAAEEALRDDEEEP